MTAGFLRWLPALILIAPVVAQFRGWPPLPEEPLRLLMNGDAAGALALVRTSAERGDAPSMFWFGRFLEEGERIPHDYPEAMRWYRRAAERGVGVAAWSIGRLHEMGRGTPRDAVEAQRWYAKAAELGFRRTALTVIKARWFPGLQELEYEPVPESLRQPPPAISGMEFLNPTAPDIMPDELEVLRKAGLRGRLMWQAGEPGMFGLPARVILIARQPVTEEVRLAAPVEGSLIYLQRDGEWQRLGEAKLAERSLRIHPQSPETPWVTSVTLEMEDGGTMSGSAWVWERR